MPLSPDAVLARFSKAERALHWSVAVLMIILILTGACLYLPVLSGLIGNRYIVQTLHIWSGFLLPIPIILAMFSRAFRRDAQRLNRFTSYDWQWLKSQRARARVGGVPVGKFNAGQKLYAAFALASIIIMLGTGSIMEFNSYFQDFLRTGATFVHDWLSLAIVVVVVGHIYKALGDATARMAMVTGSAPLSWAEREHSAWAAEQKALASTESPAPTA